MPSVPDTNEATEPNSGVAHRRYVLAAFAPCWVCNALVFVVVLWLAASLRHMEVMMASCALTVGIGLFLLALGAAIASPILAKRRHGGWNMAPSNSLAILNLLGTLMVPFAGFVVATLAESWGWL